MGRLVSAGARARPGVEPTWDPMPARRRTSTPSEPKPPGEGTAADGGALSAGAPLFATPPDEFVAARDALAKRLAEAHDPAAAAVRKLRRPAGLAWVLNHLAQHEAQATGELLAAGDRLRQGQAAALEGRGAAALREAERRVQEA